MYFTTNTGKYSNI